MFVFWRLLADTWPQIMLPVPCSIRLRSKSKSSMLKLLPSLPYRNPPVQPPNV